MIDLMQDKKRARTIVKLAASKTKIPMAKSWLTKDEKGTFEVMALDLLLRLETPEKQAIIKSNNLSDEDINEQTAIVLLVEVLNSIQRVGGA